MDSTTTISTLRSAVDKFVDARSWYKYHTPKNLAMSIAIEAAELMEHFQWYEVSESSEIMQNPEKRAEVADELADVLIYALSLATVTDIDISEAIFKKLARNEQRFPVEVVQGKLLTKKQSK